MVAFLLAQAEAAESSTAEEAGKDVHTEPFLLMRVRPPSLRGQEDTAMRQGERMAGFLKLLRQKSCVVVIMAEACGQRKNPTTCTVEVEEAKMYTKTMTRVGMIDLCL